MKVLGDNGSGTLEGAIKAISYATNAGVQIMSNSWGGGGFSQALYDVIEEAQNEGILFVAAAGNSRNDNDRWASYPATYELDNIISVGASDGKGNKASFQITEKQQLIFSHQGLISTQLIKTVAIKNCRAHLRPRQLSAEF